MRKPILDFENWRRFVRMGTFAALLATMVPKPAAATSIRLDQNVNNESTAIEHIDALELSYGPAELNAMPPEAVATPTSIPTKRPTATAIPTPTPRVAPNQETPSAEETDYTLVHIAPGVNIRKTPNGAIDHTTTTTETYRLTGERSGVWVEIEAAAANKADAWVSSDLYGSRITTEKVIATNEEEIPGNRVAESEDTETTAVLTLSAAEVTEYLADAQKEFSERITDIKSVDGVVTAFYDGKYQVARLVEDKWEVIDFTEQLTQEDLSNLPLSSEKTSTRGERLLIQTINGKETRIATWDTAAKAWVRFTEYDALELAEIATEAPHTFQKTWRTELPQQPLPEPLKYHLESASPPLGTENRADSYNIFFTTIPVAPLYYEDVQIVTEADEKTGLAARIGTIAGATLDKSGGWHILDYKFDSNAQLVTPDGVAHKIEFAGELYGYDVTMARSSVDFDQQVIGRQSGSEVPFEELPEHVGKPILIQMYIILPPDNSEWRETFAWATETLGSVEDIISGERKVDGTISRLVVALIRFDSLPGYKFSQYVSLHDPDLLNDLAEGILDDVLGRPFGLGGELIIPEDK